MAEGPPDLKDTPGRKCAIICILLLVLPILVPLLLALLPFYFIYRLFACLGSCCKQHARADNHWDEHELPPASCKCCYLGLRSAQYFTEFIEASDGQKIALDVYLPAAYTKSGQKVGCVLHQARYCRSFLLRFPFNLIVPHGCFSIVANQFGHDCVHNGNMAFVSADVRGTGASTGRFASLWSEQERNDSVQVLDWIEKQDWSDGSVGLWGLSYDATAALFTASEGHKAVKCCVCMFPFWDFYRSIAFPGGIRNKYFISTWQAVNDCLDFHRIDLMGSLFPEITSGVSPVKGSEHVIEQARSQHTCNWDASADANTVECYDDVGQFSGAHFETMSAFGVAKQLKASKVPIYFLAGWADCTVYDAISAFKAVADNGVQHEVTIGPWSHGGVQNCTFRLPTESAVFPFERECTRFLVKHLQNGGAPPGPPIVRWARPISVDTAIPDDDELAGHTTSKDGYWAESNSWNFTPTQRMYFTSAGKLTESAPDHKATMQHTGSGSMHDDDEAGVQVSRWQAMLEANRKINYDMSKCMESNVSFEGEPVTSRVEVIGMALVDAWLVPTKPDVDIFCYLCVRPKGAAVPRYMTEGLHRSAHQAAEMGVNSDAWPYPDLPHHSFRKADRKDLVPSRECHVQFHLMPACFELLPGDSLVVILSAGDSKHFDTNEVAPFQICVGGKKPPAVLPAGKWQGGYYASSITLPTQDSSAIKPGQIQVDINPVSAAAEDRPEQLDHHALGHKSSDHHQSSSPKSEKRLTQEVVDL